MESRGRGGIAARTAGQCEWCATVFAVNENTSKAVAPSVPPLVGGATGPPDRGPAEPSDPLPRVNRGGDVHPRDLDARAADSTARCR